MSLATKYRPKTFEETVGQESVLMILKQQISTDNIKNTYIFSGASGTGKTTSARCFARAVNNNCGKPIEIDAASNNGVDNIRQIISEAQTRSLDSTYKIYIIDEAHALSSNAWQALLKIIEEPPKYTIFIFCTTDPQKIPDTIKNRCMRFNFTRIPAYQIQDRLQYICMQEHFSNYEDACEYISRICKGELRNAISLLETCADYSTELSIDNVLKAIGNFSYDKYLDLVNAIIDGNSKVCLDIVNEIYNNGNDLVYFINSFLDFILDATKYIICGNISVTKFPISIEDKLKFAVGIQDASKYYMYIADKLLELKNMLKTDSDIKSTVEVIFMQMCRLV